MATVDTLPAKTRERLEAEEIYRDEVRRSLRKNRNRFQKILDFFNTSLGLFLLSGIFITGISNRVTHWQHELTEKLSRADRMEKILSEIEYRQEFFEVIDRDSFGYNDVHSIKNVFSGKIEIREDVGKLSDFEPILPEFENRSLYSLYWEWRSSSEGAEQKLLSDSLEAVREMTVVSSERRLKKIAPRNDETGAGSIWKMEEQDRTRYQQLVLKLKKLFQELKTLELKKRAPANRMTIFGINVW